MRWDTKCLGNCKTVVHKGDPSTSRFIKRNGCVVSTWPDWRGTYHAPLTNMHLPTIPTWSPYTSFFWSCKDPQLGLHTCRLEVLGPAQYLIMAFECPYLGTALPLKFSSSKILYSLLHLVIMHLPFLPGPRKAHISFVCVIRMMTTNTWKHLVFYQRKLIF